MHRWGWVETVEMYVEIKAVETVEMESWNEGHRYYKDVEIECGRYYIDVELV